MTVVNIDPRLSYVCTSTCSCVSDCCRLRLRNLSETDAHGPMGCDYDNADCIYRAVLSIKLVGIFTLIVGA